MFRALSDVQNEIDMVEQSEREPTVHATSPVLPQKDLYLPTACFYTHKNGGCVGLKDNDLDS